MKSVNVALEHRFYEHNKKLYTKLAFPYSYWVDYLQYFDCVNVIARVEEVQEIDGSFVRVDGEYVTYQKLPYYIGVKDFFKKLPKLLVASYKIAKNSEQFLLRSGNVTNLIWLWLMLFKKSYIREYPGNIKEGVTGFAGQKLHFKLLANILDYIARLQGKSSKANSFVSEYCKSLYSSSKPSYIFSSFNANEISSKKNNFIVNGVFKVVSVGRLEGEKGHSDLIKSLAEIDRKIELNLIGDGNQRLNLERLARELGVKVNFYGAITDREKLFSIMLESDLFVIPSHTEGMPRSLLEAMTLGMPCIGTNVGGIPEVLEEGSLVEPKKIEDLRSIILKVSEDDKLRGAMSLSNIDFIQKNYSVEVLKQKKINFWSELNK